MLKNSIWIIVIVFGMSLSAPGARAAGKAPQRVDEKGNVTLLNENQIAAERAVDAEIWNPKDVEKEINYNKHLFTNFIGAAKTFAKNKVDADVASDTKRAAQLRAEAQKAQEESERKRKELELNLRKVSKAVAAKSAELGDAAVEVSMVEATMGSPAFDERKLQEVTAKHKKLSDELASLGGQFKGAQGALAGAINAASDEKRKYDAQIDGLAALMDKNGDVRAAQELKHFDTGVDLMFGEMQKNYYDAKLLLMDFEVLKTKHKLNDAELAKIREKFDGQLGNTLMGQYVNEQIRKAMLKICELKDSCPASGSNSHAISEVLQKALASPRSGAPMKIPAKAKSSQAN